MSQSQTAHSPTIIALTGLGALEAHVRTALERVDTAINSTLDVEAVLTTIVTKAVQLSGTDAGTIYTFDESRQHGLGAAARYARGRIPFPRLT